MLKEIVIDSFALIDHLSLAFDAGFSALTGETGAGKSIVLDAISLLLGGRASSEMVRTGEEKAHILGLFDVPDQPTFNELWDEQGLPWPEDGQVVVTREITSSGKSVARINGRPVALATLRSIGSQLVELHGQHEHQTLFDAKQHLNILDQYGGNGHLRLLHDYRLSHQRWSACADEIKRLELDEREQMRLQDLWQFQANEIGQAKLRTGEEEQLSLERQRLANSQKIYAACQTAYELIYQGQGRQLAALDTLQRAETELSNLVRFDPEAQANQQLLLDCIYQLEDLARWLSRYQETAVYNPDALAKVEDRLDQIHNLKRKYGDSIEEILSYEEEITQSLHELGNREERLQNLRHQLGQYEAVLSQAAEALGASRHALGKTLQEAVMMELNDLAMPKCQFAIAWTALNGQGWQGCQYGAENCEFLISPNAGEPLRPLIKIASGGELSRILLALKTVLARTQRIPTLIFDEIDVGVSGHAAQKIASKLAELSMACQIVVVTHLAQIAAMAECHFHIEKTVVGDRTVTRVHPLSDAQRPSEVARLLAGGTDSGLAEQHAAELLSLARMFREKQKSKN